MPFLLFNKRNLYGFNQDDDEFSERQKDISLFRNCLKRASEIKGNEKDELKFADITQKGWTRPKEPGNICGTGGRVQGAGTTKKQLR